MADLSPIPYRVKIADPNGLITRNWQQFFEALLRRVGGAGTTPSLDEINATATTESDFSSGVARAEALRGALADLEALVVMSDAVSTIAPPDSIDLFEVPTPAEVEKLRQALRDLEAITLFSW